MSDKNSWESFTDSADGCLNVVVLIAVILGLLFWAVVEFPTLASAIWRAIIWSIEHVLPMLLVVLAIILVAEFADVAWRRIRRR